MRASSAAARPMWRTVTCSGICMLAAPVDAHRVLVLGEAHVEIAVIGPLESPSDAARGMHVASCDHRLGRRLDDVHDSMHRVLGAFVLGRVAGELQQLGAMGVEELT